MSNDQLYSYHVFLFPFQWYYPGDFSQDKTLEEKTDPSRFVSMMNQAPQWKRTAFTPDTILKYNEYNYFYDSVRNILYDKEPEEEEFIYHFDYDLEPDTQTYRFGVNLGSNGTNYQKVYALHIDSITLHLYNTGVGVLSFHLNNRKKDQSSKDDILKINQFGRRIYPPFFGIDQNIVGAQAQFEDRDFENGLQRVQQKEMPAHLTLGDDATFEDFSRYMNPEYFKNNPFQLPLPFEQLFREIPVTTNPSTTESSNKKIFLSPLLDDRMFVVCWYGNNKLLDKLNANPDQKGKNEDGEYLYKKNDWWYTYLFVDPNFPTCQNDEMMEDLLADHTNARWLNYGTLYGISRYSFVCLTGTLDQLKNDNAAYLVNHVQTMYYKISELCLVQRACLLRFGKEVADISSFKESRKKELANSVSSLHKQYIRFVNRIFFREVTAQDQGIELYDLLQQKMNIPKNKEDLGNEIEVLHNYANMRQETEQTWIITMLTWIATILLPPTLVAAYFSMQFKDGWGFAGFSDTFYKPFWSWY